MQHRLESTGGRFIHGKPLRRRSAAPPLAGMLDPPRSGPGASAAIQLLSHLTAANAERQLSTQRGRAPSELGRLVAKYGDERQQERTNSRCPPSVAMMCGLVPDFHPPEAVLDPLADVDL